jgi:hypothetical protein
MKKRFSTFPRLFPFTVLPLDSPSGVRRSEGASTAIELSLSPEVEAPPSCTTEEESWEEGRLRYPNAVGTTERGVSSPANPDRVVWVPMSMTIAETSSAGFCFYTKVVVVNMSVLCRVRGRGRGGCIILRLIWSLKDG